jgi:hypothetical protein
MRSLSLAALLVAGASAFAPAQVVCAKDRHAVLVRLSRPGDWCLFFLQMPRDVS